MIRCSECGKHIAMKLGVNVQKNRRLNETPYRGGENMKIGNIRKLKCGICKGSGSTRNWLGAVSLEYKDCANCKGKGWNNVGIRDLRKISKKKMLVLPYDC